MDNFQELTNMPAIDINMAMDPSGQSDSVKLVDSILTEGYPSQGAPTLSESLKEISSLTPITFDEAMSKTSSSLGGFGGFGGGGPRDGSDLFKVDNSESWNQEINLNDYYTKMSDDWSRLDKTTGSAAAIGGLTLTGAATGAAIGSMVAPGVGTVVGGVIGGILGAAEGIQVSKTVGAGFVRNKYGVNEDALSRTGFWNQAGTASMKMIHSANAVNLSLVGMLAYAPQAISQGSLSTLYNNKFSKLLDDYDKSSEHSNRVYHSKEYDNASLLGSFTYSEMWTEKVAPAIGFTLGALAGGKGTGTILKAAGMTGTGTASASRAFLSNLPKNIAISEATTLGTRSLVTGFKEAVKADLKAQTFKSIAGNTLSTMVSAAPEAGIEARGAVNEAREDFKHYFQIANGRMATSEELAAFEKDNIRSANGIFATNMAILSASNWLQFGDLIGVDKAVREGFFDKTIKNAFGLGIKKTVGEVGEKGVAETIWSMANRTRGQKIGYGIFKALENPITEGTQEGLQGIVSGAQKEYLESRFNPMATEANKSIISSVGSSFAYTMGSREGWEEILIGMLVGGMSSVRSQSGVDFLNIRESMNAGKVVQGQVDTLNRTSSAFTEAHRDYLEKVGSYNMLNNNYITRLNDRIGSANQQMVSSDRSKQHLADGNLELARTSYQNALFAKLSAERNAGISDSSKFDVEMLIEETPDEVLKDMYGFQTQEEIDAFKEDSKKRLNLIHDSFNAAYDMAETLNLGTGFKDFSPAQVTEMAALNIFHGLQSADNANSIANNLENIVGINGVASALNHYTNLSEKHKEQINELRRLDNETEDLRLKHTELLESFSKESTASVRTVENTEVVSKLDKINAELESVSNQLQAVEDRKNALNSILDSRQALPSLPFGNSASKFFENTGLTLADRSTREVIESLDQFDNYVNHLRDTTAKSEEEIAEDNNKADIIEGMILNYKNQMGLMRNFAKTSQMIADPAYVNNISKGIFNSKKYHEIFDNEDWVNNNESMLDELTKAEYKELQQRLKEGVISIYDIHTYLTNSEILRLGRGTLEVNKNIDPISDIKLQSVISLGENGEQIFDSESEVGKQLINQTALSIYEKRDLSPNEKIVFNLNKDTIAKEVNRIASDRPATILSKTVPERNTKLAETERLRRITDQRKEEVREKVLQQFPISKLVSGEVSLPGEVETEGLTQNEALQVLEDEIARQQEKIEADYQEALNPIEPQNVQVKEVLSQLNTVIDSIVKSVQEQNKEINADNVDSFEAQSTPIKKEFNRIKELLALGTRTESQQRELDGLLNKVNSYGLIEGRVESFNGQEIRLSDLLQQRSQLENELFNKDRTLKPLSEEALKMTFDSTTEDESTLPIKEGERVGDAAVLNNYDFVTFTQVGSTYQISNLTPQGFVEEITRDKDYSIVATDSEGNIRVINNESDFWDREVESGDTVMLNITLEDGSSVPVSFLVDNSRRILLPIETADLVTGISPLTFNGKNVIGSSKHHVLTREFEAQETYLESDFGIDIDVDAAQSLNPGDPLTFEYDAENSYNQMLKEEFDRAFPDPEAPEMQLESMVEELIGELQSNKTGVDSKSEGVKRRNKEILDQLHLLIPGVEGNKISSFKSALNKIVKPYKKQFSEKEKDLARKKFKDNMVLVAKDSSGNTVGVLKSLSNSNVRGRGRYQMDHLRSAVMDQLSKNNFRPNTKSKFKVPVQIVYMGIPNIKSETGEKITYRFSETPGDRNIHPGKITSVGYVTYNKMEFSNKKKISTPYNYAKKILEDETYVGRRVPVVSFMHQGKEVIYPITLMEKTTEPVSQVFTKLLEQKDSMTVGDFILSVNDFLAENGVSKGVRLTSLNIDEALPDVIDIVNNIPNVLTIDELMSGNFRDVLTESAIIDINLNDKPFVGPKIRFDLNKVPESNSKLITTETNVTNTMIPQSMEEIANEIDNNNCIE